MGIDLAHLLNRMMEKDVLSYALYIAVQLVSKL
jgi:hypothetical protein